MPKRRSPRRRSSVDAVYRTPWYNHNAIEPHATIALWTADDHLSVFDSTQVVGRFAATLGEVFGLKPTDVDVIAPFVGGGFGGKAGLWRNTVLCAAAAKAVKRPVRLALSREQVYPRRRRPDDGGTARRAGREATTAG